MSAFTFLLIVCCLKLSWIACQRSHRISLVELIDDLLNAEKNNQWSIQSSIWKGGSPFSKAATSNVRGKQKPSRTRRILNNTDNHYNGCFEQRLSCDSNYKYRSFDGSCNNLRNPTWGMANTTYFRLLPAAYRDRRYLPPVAIDGKPLPSPRTLSSEFFPDGNNDDRKATLVVMQWGQFITHDLALTANVNNSENINCCNGTMSHDERVCFPIQIPPNDPFYAQLNISCQNMVRNAFILAPYCSGVAEQFNLASHLLDGSAIYGSDPNVVKTLREFKSGRLSTQTCGSGQDFLRSKSSTAACDADEEAIRFLAGDSRVNQNPQLTILHTLFVREHNRIVETLQRLHPNWSDEILFQEGRSIVIAELQHITYNEWLPLILGKALMNRYSLYSNKNRNYTYNNTVAPVTLNSLISSVFRSGHSAIQGQIRTYSSYSGCPLQTFNFSNLLNRPGTILHEQQFDEFTRGLTKQSMQNIDSFHTREITQQLFHGNSSHGTDLLSTDIQRGRDHGIPPYVDYLNLCTGYKPRSFQDLKKFIKIKFIMQLQQHYADVKDIDLFIGGLVENPSEGARVGPTFRCIIAEQFYRYKFGDRFWYEIRGQQHSFTNAQLYQIKKATLSRIICDNSNNILDIAPQSFLQHSDKNNVVSCQDIPAINLTMWKQSNNH